MTKKVLLLLTFLFVQTLAQNKYDFTQFVDEGKEYFSSPLSWQAKDFLYLGLTIGVTFGASQFDNTIKDFTQSDKLQDSPPHILIGRIYGEPVTPLVLSSYFIINGNSTGNRYQKKLGFEIIQSTLFAAATTQILKSLLGRERPRSTDDKYNFTGPILYNNDFFSLPSGHTTIAFAISTVLSANSSSDLLKIASFIPAILTAYSRIYENQHWFSDVVLGGIIGFTAAKFFVDQHSEKEFIGNSTPSPIFSLSIPL